MNNFYNVFNNNYYYNSVFSNNYYYNNIFNNNYYNNNNNENINLVNNNFYINSNNNNKYEDDTINIIINERYNLNIYKDVNDHDIPEFHMICILRNNEMI